MRNRDITPFRLLLFFLTVFSVVLLLSHVLPAETELPLNLKLRMFTTQEVFEKSLNLKKRIAPEAITPVSEPDYAHYQLLFPDEWEEAIRHLQDSLDIHASLPVFANEGELKTRIFALHCDEAFLKSLYAFFQKVEGVKTSGKTIRVLHYGDSQIEGDRVTSELREQFQKKFGGMGPGLLPLVPPTRHGAIFHFSYTGSWSRYSAQAKDLPHNRWGVLFGVSRFTKPGEIDEGEHEAGFDLRSRMGYANARRFRKVSLYYGNHERPLYLELLRTGISLDADIIPPDEQLMKMEYSWREPVNNVSVRMKGKSSPDVYAIALDDHHGVAVDNIPLRGSSGLEFTRSDTEFMRRMFNELNTGMILMQFGVNVVPYIVSDYSYYETGLYRQLMLLKRLNPNIPVIVLGVSDMSMIDGGVYRSYPNIELIRDAQRNAALRAGCAFWDTYEAMGGENSMATWVYADPPLAQRDFTHFSQRGSKLIGQMFWNALLDEYEKYKELKE